MRKLDSQGFTLIELILVVLLLIGLVIGMIVGLKSCGSGRASPSVTPQRAMETVTALRMRECPNVSDQCAVIEVLPAGTQVLVLAKEGKWRRIKKPSREAIGWVHGDYLRPYRQERGPLARDSVETIGTTNPVVGSLLLAFNPLISPVVPAKLTYGFSRVFGIAMIWVSLFFAVPFIANEMRIDPRPVAQILFVMCLFYTGVLLFSSQPPAALLIPFMTLSSILISYNGFLFIRAFSSFGTGLMSVVVLGSSCVLYFALTIGTGSLLPAKIFWIGLTLVALIRVAVLVSSEVSWGHQGIPVLIVFSMMSVAIFVAFIDVNDILLTVPDSLAHTSIMIRLPSFGFKWSYTFGLLVGLLFLSSGRGSEREAIAASSPLLVGFHTVLLVIGMGMASIVHFFAVN